jgi:hypothetical protein
MFQYVCDSCSAVKQPEETWILGIAAEAVAPTAARREVNILSRWDPVTAADPLAVHFCSLECRMTTWPGYLERQLPREK